VKGITALQRVGGLVHPTAARPDRDLVKSGLWARGPEDHPRRAAQGVRRLSRGAGHRQRQAQGCVRERGRDPRRGSSSR
jgi:hypothetical protein